MEVAGRQMSFTSLIDCRGCRPETTLDMVSLLVNYWPWEDDGFSYRFLVHVFVGCAMPLVRMCKRWGTCILSHKVTLLSNFYEVSMLPSAKSYFKKHVLIKNWSICVRNINFSPLLPGIIGRVRIILSTTSWRGKNESANAMNFR